MNRRNKKSELPTDPSGSSISVHIGRDATGNAIGHGASVNNSGVIAGGNANHQSLERAFAQIRAAVEARPAARNVDKEEIAGAIQELENLAQKGKSADETSLKHCLRSIGRMAPDILDVVIEAFINPALAIGMVLRKIALKVKEEAK